jgi:hypothetical protein
VRGQRAIGHPKRGVELLDSVLRLGSAEGEGVADERLQPLSATR